MKQVIQHSIVNLNDDVSTAVYWGQDADSNDSIDDDQTTDNQVLNNISHIIIFETEQDHKQFKKAMEKEIPQALCAAGGTTALLDSSLTAIEAGTPLFIFNHTVRTGYLLSRLMKFRASTDINRHDELRVCIRERI